MENCMQMSADRGTDIHADGGTESLTCGREGWKPDQSYNLLSEGLKTLVLLILLIQKIEADQRFT